MAWLVALLLKPLFVVGVTYAYHLLVYRGSLWLSRFIPDPLFDVLFRERGCFDRRYGLAPIRPHRTARARPRNSNQRLLQ